jgi:hypothetical protein
MKEGYTIMKDSKGNAHEAPVVKAPYLKNLLNRQIEVSFGDNKCIGVFEGEDEDFISIITKEGQEMISKHSIKKILPIYTQSDRD